jgi:hypothetical protein
LIASSRILAATNCPSWDVSSAENASGSGLSAFGVLNQRKHSTANREELQYSSAFLAIRTRSGVVNTSPGSRAMVPGSGVPGIQVEGVPWGFSPIDAGCGPRVGHRAGRRGLKRRFSCGFWVRNAWYARLCEKGNSYPSRVRIRLPLRKTPTVPCFTKPIDLPLSPSLNSTRPLSQLSNRALCSSSD